MNKPTITDNAKWIILGIVLAALLILATAIGPSIDALAAVDYKLEVWAFILILVAFLIAYIVKKATVVVNVPDKAIKVYVDVTSINPTNTNTSHAQSQELEQKEKPVVEIVCDEKTKLWPSVDVGEISLDGEKVDN